jgi:hypothetical protein
MVLGVHYRFNCREKKFKITEWGAEKLAPTCEFAASSKGGLGGHYWYHINRIPLHTSFKLRQGAGHAPTCHHVFYSTGPCLPTKVGSEATTCIVALDPTSLRGRALVSPHVP